MPRSRVLIVEDDTNLRRVIRLVVERIDLEVSEAGDGREALARLGEARPDVAIVDMRMPGMDGRELIRLIRANPETSSMPIVMLSGVTEIGSGHQADAVLRKPFEAKDLIETVRSLLTRESAGA